MIAEKRAPLLPSCLLGANMLHVLLDGALADMNAQFQEFSANPFCTPESILFRHLPDQGDGFGGDFRLVGRSLCSSLPIQTEELPMPARASCLVARVMWACCQVRATRASRTRRMRSVLVYAGRFTCRLRMIRGFRKRAFSARSSVLLLPRSLRVVSGREVLSGLVQ